MPKHEIIQNTDIVSVVERYVSLSKKGAEYVGLCPFHDDHKKSLNVNPSKQLYFCGACGAAGDVADFIIGYGKTFAEAISEIKSYSGLVEPEKIKTVKKPKTIWKDAMPDFLPAEISHYIHGKPSMVFPYHNAEGFIIGYTCRFDLPDGTKEVLPFTFKTNGKYSQWMWMGFDRPRPIYNLNLLAQYPAHRVIIVEGEKTADAINNSTKSVIAITWPGGSRGVPMVDWSPVKDRKKTYWPDNDEPGISAMINIREIAGEGMMVHVPGEYPAKWDAADKVWDRGEIKEFIMQNSDEFPEPSPNPPEGIKKWWVHGANYSAVHNIEGFIFKKYTPEETKTHEQKPPPVSPKKNKIGFPDQPFRFLGFEKIETKLYYVFFIESANQVLKYTAASLSKNILLTLAPVSFWEFRFLGDKKGANYEAAINWLIQTAQSCGVYDPDSILGLGTWMDEGRAVVHVGDSLIVDGIRTDFKDHSSRYVYEMKRSVDINVNNILPTSESAKLIEIFKKIKWEREVSAHLLAGWCVIAPICGALKWRPHVWITGGAGTGKSWIMSLIVRRLLGNTALSVQGETTEAGIRQYLGSDARPVLFDEAEGEDRKSAERIQNVLNLMRGASTGDGGAIIKGSAGGTASKYDIRSCFIFASIGLGMSQQSDRSRVSVLSIQGRSDDENEDRWNALKAYQEMLTDEWCESLRARTISLLPIITHNIKVFSNAAAIELASQRMGDQLGALLAGAYSLVSKDVISPEKAKEWVLKHTDQWYEERGDNLVKDEMQLFERLMDFEARVEIPGIGSTTRTVGELALIAYKTNYDDAIGAVAANDRLKRMGIKVENDSHAIVISNTAPAIRRILSDTPWSRNHGKVLKRIEGSVEISNTRFSTGLASRAVAIPIEYISVERRVDFSEFEDEPF